MNQFTSVPIYPRSYQPPCPNHPCPPTPWLGGDQRHGAGAAGRGKAVMDPDNALRILRGEQFVDLIPERFRKRW
jgi:hypothetical protein